MTILDIILITCGFLIGVGAFLSGKDSLYKLFLGLIIGFLAYTLAESQIALMQTKTIAERDSYEIFLSAHVTSILTALLLLVPVFGIFFMLHPRLYILTYKKSPSQLLLGILLPFFLVGILAYLGKESLLTQNDVWNRIFDFFASSFIYQVFEKLPWAIFALLLFLLLYKTLFILVVSFGLWLYRDVIPEIFASWSRRKSHQLGGDKEDGE
ncbi:hypothetical protein LAT59_00375 [Candidatus Gracilibacteria bacterium]|nr:hypothetical protein [Candidatus Gracilibacteria bacterium]